MGELKILMVNESTAKSIITDTYTFGCFVGCLFLNYFYLGNSTVLQIFICLILLLLVYGRSSGMTKKMTPDEALKYLTERDTESRKNDEL